MTGIAYEPAVGTEAPPPPPRRGRRALIAVGIALLCAGALVGMVAMVFAAMHSTKTTAAPLAPPPPGVHHRSTAIGQLHDLDLGTAPPAREAVPRIERYVEELRGHKFKRHVKVTVLPKRAFIEKLHAAGSGGSGSDNGTDIAAMLVALRLVDPLANLSALNQETADEAVGGFYDPRTKALYVRGTRLNPLAQVILAHELTHALDDQYFNLQRLERGVKNGDQGLAVGALIEGDARWVENQFRSALTAKRRAQVRHEIAAEFNGDTSGIPGALLTLGAFPYDVGSAFVQAVYDSGGSGGVDAAFRRPPKSTLEIMNPTQAFLDQRVDGVAAPTPSYTGTRFSHDRLGALGLALMLADGGHVDLASSGTPTTYWRGDSYVTYRRGFQVCLRDRIVVSRGGVAVLGGALRSWAAEHASSYLRSVTQRTSSSVRVEARNRLLLTTCTL